MSRSLPQAEQPPVWAIPISLESVALWCELPSTSSDVAITLQGVASELRFKRRLITVGRRLYLSVLRTKDVKASEPCRVTYRPEPGRPMIRFQTAPSLAEWTTASVTAAVHAILEGLATENGEADTRLLARFLSLTSSWAAPCRYHGTESGLGFGVFEFVPKAFESISVVAVANGLVTTRRMLPVPHDEQSCCLVWQGEPFDHAYLELEGELLELKLETFATVKPLTSWFAELAPEQQDAVLDGVGLFAPEQGATGLQFGRHLSSTRDFRVGSRSIAVSAVFRLASKICLVADDPGDGGLSLRLSPLGKRDHEHEARRLASVELGQGRSVVFSTGPNPDFKQVDGGPIRVSFGFAEMAASHWMPVQGLENSLDRGRIRNLIDWGSADEEFVRDFAVGSIGIEAISQNTPPAEIALMTVESPVDAAIFICRYSGDFPGLRSTLIALRLTAGDDMKVRLVSRRSPTPREVLDLRSLCQTIGLGAGLMVLNDGAPFSDALKVDSDERRHKVVILADSGIVPLDRDWWQRLSGILERDPTLLCYSLHERQSASETSASSHLSGSSPLLAAGSRLAPGILDPDFELQTFEGFLQYALTVAERAGNADHLGWLRLMNTASAVPEVSLGAARLDEAMIAAALAARNPGTAVHKGSLVHLAQRAGAG